MFYMGEKASFVYMVPTFRTKIYVWFTQTEHKMKLKKVKMLTLSILLQVMTKCLKNNVNDKTTVLFCSLVTWFMARCLRKPREYTLLQFPQRNFELGRGRFFYHALYEIWISMSVMINRK